MIVLIDSYINWDRQQLKKLPGQLICPGKRKSAWNIWAFDLPGRNPVMKTMKNYKTHEERINFCRVFIKKRIRTGWYSIKSPLKNPAKDFRKKT
jgi:hypothetical protein